jgi:hypothetical protein
MSQEEILAMTVFDVLRRFWTSPGEMLLRGWNWKSSIFSSVLRALLFLCANLTAGWRAAGGAMLAEFVYRAITAGFYGAITQAFRQAQPAWAASVAALLLLPMVSHSMELALHLARGTPKIVASIICSVCFTAISTLFHLYATRRGALVVGDGTASLASDMKRLPGLIVGFVASGPIALYQLVLTRSSAPILKRSSASTPVPVDELH